MTAREVEAENVRQRRDALRAMTTCVRLLERVAATKWEHDEGCWPSEGQHSAKCRLRKKLLEDIRCALEGGLYP